MKNAGKTEEVKVVIYTRRRALVLSFYHHHGRDYWGDQGADAQLCY